MALIQWTSELEIGYKIIDDQHKKLVDLLNDLHGAMIQGKSKEILASILKELIKYTGYHFKDEEGYMKKFNYQDFNNHCIEHDNFVKKMLGYQDDFANQKALLSIDIMNFLKDWLINHIMGTDRKYISTFNENGMK